MLFVVCCAHLICGEVVVLSLEGEKGGEEIRFWEETFIIDAYLCGHEEAVVSVSILQSIGMAQRGVRGGLSEMYTLFGTTYE